MASYDGKLAGDDELQKMPDWFVGVVKGLIQGDPKSRMSVSTALQDIYFYYNRTYEGLDCVLVPGIVS